MTLSIPKERYKTRAPQILNNREREGAWENQSAWCQ